MEKDITNAPEEVKVEPVENSQYVPLFIAKSLSILIALFGALALIVLTILMFGASIGNLVPDGDSEEVSDEVIEQRLNESLPPVNIGTATDISVSDSTESIIELFEENDAVANNYWEFRSILSNNTSFFVEVVGVDTVIDSPNQIGSDTVAILTDGESTCEIALEGELTATCK